MEYGFLSIIPPLLTIVLAIITKEVLLSLCIGVFGGYMIIAAGSPMVAFEKMISGIIATLTVPWNMQVILIVMMLGGLIGLLTRSGGSKAFAEFIGSKIKSRKGAQGTAWILGLMIFFDDYFNALTNGAVMRPVCDRAKVSREKLSYIIDSTAVGICLLVPISSWVAFITSLIAGSFKTAGIQQDAFQAFLFSVPYNYYAWLSILMVGAVIYFGLDFGPMARAEKRTMETGKLCDATFSGGAADEDDFSAIKQMNGKVRDLLVPIVLLIAGAFTFMLYTGGFFGIKHRFDLMNAINNMSGTIALVYAIFLTVIFAMVFYKLRGLSSISDSIAAFVIGAKSMVFVLILLAFAWTIGAICDALGTGDYVSSLLGGFLPGYMVPVIVFLFSCVMAFSTGASWGTYAVMMPVAIPLAVHLNADVLACIAAVIGGGGFGNHCSPLADTAILSSAGANIRHIDHINTQIPYSVTCAAVASVAFILAGILKSPIVPMIACLALFIIVVVILNKLFGAKTIKLAEVEPLFNSPGMENVSDCENVD